MLVGMETSTMIYRHHLMRPAENRPGRQLGWISGGVMVR